MREAGIFGGTERYFSDQLIGSKKAPRGKGG